ncbi:MAG: TetR/AcrR family transcriptional regulator [Candidatus Delongbacteria bacterium]|nr:TetR/AcrR family transcriptional regulator [Candidatus Delongbacteria bacterium]
MTRVVKEYSERKNEIIDIAQKLFYQKGYDATSIANIIEVVNIAKGTFYHYFKSKEDLLYQLTKRQGENILQKVKCIACDKNLSGIEKFQKIIDDISSYKVDNVEAMIVMTKAMYKPENIKLRLSIQDIIKVSSGEFSKVVLQGVNEGVFYTDYPEFITDIIFSIGIYIRDEFAEYICKDNPEPGSYDKLKTKFRMYQNSIEKLLGVKKGVIKMFDEDILNVFIRRR